MTKVLIVEDNESIRRALRDLLGDFGEIYECDDGTEALSAYVQHCPEWVLMDLMMSKKGGLTATREIKAAFPDARIVIVTVHDDDELREAARCAGACEYVIKENLFVVREILLTQIQKDKGYEKSKAIS